jgi:hypothetical protein
MNEVQNEVLSLQDEDTRNKIRTRYIKGQEMVQILAELEIPEGTWNSALWRNTHNLQAWFMVIKREKMLYDAERVSSEILSMKTDGENAKILAIKQKEAEFIRETQGKDAGYSKRIETIGLNINKNEPLDDEQKAKLDKLIKKSGIVSDLSNTDVVENGSTEPF